MALEGCSVEELLVVEFVYKYSPQACKLSTAMELGIRCYSCIAQRYNESHAIHTSAIRTL